MRHAMERHKVVLTRRVEGDVLHKDKLLMVEVERGGKDIRGVLVQTREDLGVRLGHALWRVQEASTLRVFTDGQEDLPDSGFNARTVYFMAVLGAHGGTVGGGEVVVVVEMSHGR
ncbi:hypothetical protein StoSoilB20_01720 [Arthrobacter sp. StoSoilB20]|nr:hypothetical protein StoSoilB20_01720 [Arthrobacter sp. StoSoilB20]